MTTPGKLLKYSVAIALVLFFVITIITSKYESPFDGKDYFGFPLRFYEYYVGFHMLSEKHVEVRNFNAVNLGLDLLLTLGVSFLISFGVNKWFFKHK